MKIADKTKEELVSLVERLVSHLDYCGWGDSWEREVSEDLMKEVDSIEDLKRMLSGIQEDK